MPTHTGVQKDEVHLDEGEGEPQAGGDRTQHVTALGALRRLEVLTHLQTRVDHAANSEHCKHTEENEPHKTNSENAILECSLKRLF